MRRYCNCLRGDWGITLLKKVISTSVLLWHPSAVSQLGDTHSKKLQWLAAGPTLATAGGMAGSLSSSKR